MALGDRSGLQRPWLTPLTIPPGAFPANEGRFCSLLHSRALSAAEASGRKEEALASL